MHTHRLIIIIIIGDANHQGGEPLLADNTMSSGPVHVHVQDYGTIVAFICSLATFWFLFQPHSCMFPLPRY